MSMIPWLHCRLLNLQKADQQAAHSRALWPRLDGKMYLLPEYWSHVMSIDLHSTSYRLLHVVSYLLYTLCIPKLERVCFFKIIKYNTVNASKARLEQHVFHISLADFYHLYTTDLSSLFIGIYILNNTVILLNPKFEHGYLFICNILYEGLKG
jgi:hypothetical protein